MTSHEIAKLLLAMPDETVFVRTDEGSKIVESVELCDCGCEIFIYYRDYLKAKGEG